MARRNERAEEVAIGARSDVRMEMIQAEGWQAGIGTGTKE